MELTKTQERVFTSDDRCDACSASAQVSATFINGELLFCGHHARKSVVTLKSKALNLYDPENQLGLLRTH